MKEALFNWLSGLGVDVTSLMALVIALGIIITSLLLLAFFAHPTFDGLPLKIYCFTATTAWADYEGSKPIFSTISLPSLSNFICGCINLPQITTCVAGNGDKQGNRAGRGRGDIRLLIIDPSPLVS